MIIQKHLHLGCTKTRHQQLGVHAIINARAGLQSLNSQSLDDIELIRDSIKIKEKINNRVSFYQFNSSFFRRNLGRVKHLISEYSECY